MNIFGDLSQLLSSCPRIGMIKPFFVRRYAFSAVSLRLLGLVNDFYSGIAACESTPTMGSWGRSHS